MARYAHSSRTVFFSDRRGRRSCPPERDARAFLAARRRCESGAQSSVSVQLPQDYQNEIDGSCWILLSILRAHWSCYRLPGLLLALVTGRAPRDSGSFMRTRARAPVERWDHDTRVRSGSGRCVDWVGRSTGRWRSGESSSKMKRVLIINKSRLPTSSAFCAAWAERDWLLRVVTHRPGTRMRVGLKRRLVRLRIVLYS